MCEGRGNKGTETSCNIEQVMFNSLFFRDIHGTLHDYFYIDHTIVSFVK